MTVEASRTEQERAAALALTRARDWAAADEAWSRLVARTGGGFEALYRQSEALFFLQRLADAIAVGRRAAAANPADIRPLVIIGRAQANQGQQSEATETWSAVTALDPGNFEAWARLAQGALALGQIEPAARALLRALQLQPGNFFALGTAEQLRGQLAPDQGKALLSLARQAADGAETISLLKAILLIDPDNRAGRHELAQCLFRALPAADRASLGSTASGPIIETVWKTLFAAGRIDLKSRKRSTRCLVVLPTACSDAVEHAVKRALRSLAFRLGPEQIRLAFHGSLGGGKRHPSSYGAEETGVEVLDAETGAAGRIPDPLSPQLSRLLEILGPDHDTATRRLLTVIRQVEPAVVHIWGHMANPDGALAAVLAGVPRIIMTAVEAPPPESDELRAAYRAALTHPSGVDGSILLTASTAQVARDCATWLGLKKSAIPTLVTGRLASLYKLAGKTGQKRLRSLVPRTRAREKMRRGAWAGAAASWQYLLALDPVDVEAQIGAGRAYLMQREMPAAHSHFAEALRLGAPEALRWLARTAREAGDHRSALENWSKLAAAEPGDIEALLRVAEALAGLGEEAQAIAGARAALERHAGDHRLIRLLARLLQHAGALSEALSHWEALAQRGAPDPEALFRAGQVALALGEDEQAERHLGVALALPDCDPRAAAVLARHMAWSGRRTEARALLRVFWRRHPDDEGIARAVFEWMRVGGRLAALDRYFARGVRRASDPAAQLRLAEQLAAADRVSAARKLLETLAAGPGTDSIPNMAGQRLARMALRATEVEEAVRTAARFALPAPLAREIESTARWYKGIRGKGGRLDPAEAFIERIAAAATARRDAPRYAIKSGLVLHLANSLAAGGSERQCVSVILAQAAQAKRGPARTALLRTDPARHGRATFFLPRILEAGIATATLEEFALASRLRTPPPELAVEPGELGGILVSRQLAPLTEAIRSYGPEAIVVWSPQCMADAALAGMVMGVPRVVLRSGSVALPSRETTTDTEALRYVLWRNVLRRALKHPAGCLLNNCEANLADWLEWLGLTPSEIGGRCGALPNLLDLQAFPLVAKDAQRRLRQSLGISADGKIVGSVIRLEQEKGLDLWLETVRAMRAVRPDVVFVLAGEGRLDTQLRRAVAAGGLSDAVRFTGKLGSALPNYYAIFDALLLTSHVEGLPNAAIEAQCYGLPVIAPRIGGIPDALAPELPHGLIDGRDPRQYAEALDRAFRQGPAQRRRIEIGRRFVETRFSANSVLASLDRYLALSPGAGSRAGQGSKGTNPPREVQSKKSLD
jgi:glycosyltransferase involved in cell wall biosynthesis/tetratricopeptide (TPR) repeat protein